MIYYDIYYKNKLPEAFTSIENKHYFELYKNGDKNAREELILHNLKLVLNMVKVYKVDNTEELISVGTVGLIKAIDTFDVDKGYTFATYSVVCIRNEILMFLRDKKNKEIAISLDNIINNEDNSSDSLKVADKLKDDFCFTEDLEEQELYNAIRESFSILTDIERKIVQMSFGFYDENPMIQKEVAKELKISRSSVSRIEKRARLKIEKYIENRGLFECASKELAIKTKIRRK